MLQTSNEQFPPALRVLQESNLQIAEQLSKTSDRILNNICFFKHQQSYQRTKGRLTRSLRANEGLNLDCKQGYSQHTYLARVATTQD